MNKRIIKFRAYHTRLNKMVDPDMFFGKCNSVMTSFEIMQFTGLKDKNDKEIYEGDIVRWGLNFSGTGYDHEIWHRYALVELFPALQFKIIKYFNTDKNKFEKGDDHIFGFSNFMYSETDRYLEVIGNIHENPELI